MRRIFGSLVVLWVCLGGWQPVTAQNLFAIGFAGSNPATFFTVNRTTGLATAVGPVGFNTCSGMDVSTMGTVVAACDRGDGSATPVLVTIDPVTGAGTEVGPTGIANGRFTDLSFQPSSGTLFGNDGGQSLGASPSLFTANTNTGVGSPIGPSGLFVGAGEALGFHADGTLFLVQSDGFDPTSNVTQNTINPGTGVGTFVRNLTIPLPPPATFYRPKAIDFDPVTGLFFGILATDGGGAGPTFLITIDTATGNVVVIGQTEDTLDAIACRGNAVPVELQQFFIE